MQYYATKGALSCLQTAAPQDLDDTVTLLACTTSRTMRQNELLWLLTRHTVLISDD